MTLQPIKNLVLVERCPMDNKTAGGIILPDSPQQQSQYGTVMAIGSKVEVITPGDTVFYGKYAGTNIDDVQLILREEDILAFVKKDVVDTL